MTAVNIRIDIETHTNILLIRRYLQSKENRIYTMGDTVKHVVEWYLKEVMDNESGNHISQSKRV